MALFRKKKKDEEFMLPDPPEAPDMSFDMEEEEQEELPKIPSLEKYKKNSSIKQEFEMDDDIEFQNATEQIKMPMPTNAPPKIPSYQGEAARRFRMPMEKPIFIKIDKFKESIENLNSIKDRLRNSSSLLRKIKEIRQREDAELAEWEKNLEKLKEKLEDIDKKLFSDIE